MRKNQQGASYIAILAMKAKPIIAINIAIYEAPF